MMELDRIFNEDCLEGMKRIPDGMVDCIVTDPPYKLENQGGGFWSKNEDPAQNHYNARGTRKGMDRLGDIKDGITDEVLDEMCRVMKRINIYIFCSQKQIQQYLDYFVTRRGCNWNLLTWHKTNPIPACGNKYLNDTEYILFFREKGVKVYGSYDTKHTFYVSLRNQEDNVRYHHPTVKPLQIIRNFVLNSTVEGGGNS
jgi:DNA modification methylase